MQDNTTALSNVLNLFKNIQAIDGWQNAWKLLSMQFPALNSTLIIAWLALPEKLQDTLPVSWLLTIALVLLALGMAGRLVKQPIDLLETKVEVKPV
jgi:hypothetical protein